MRTQRGLWTPGRAAQAVCAFSLVCCLLFEGGAYASPLQETADDSGQTDSTNRYNEVPLHHAAPGASLGAQGGQPSPAQKRGAVREFSDPAHTAAEEDEREPTLTYESQALRRATFSGDGGTPSAKGDGAPEGTRELLAAPAEGERLAAWQRGVAYTYSADLKWYIGKGFGVERAALDEGKWSPPIGPKNDGARCDVTVLPVARERCGTACYHSGVFGDDFAEFGTDWEIEYGDDDRRSDGDSWLLRVSLSHCRPLVSRFGGPYVALGAKHAPISGQMTETIGVPFWASLLDEGPIVRYYFHANETYPTRRLKRGLMAAFSAVHPDGHAVASQLSDVHPHAARRNLALFREQLDDNGHLEASLALEDVEFSSTDLLESTFFSQAAALDAAPAAPALVGPRMRTDQFNAVQRRRAMLAASLGSPPPVVSYEAVDHDENGLYAALYALRRRDADTVQLRREVSMDRALRTAASEVQEMHARRGAPHDAGVNYKVSVLDVAVENRTIVGAHARTVHGAPKGPAASDKRKDIHVPTKRADHRDLPMPPSEQVPPMFWIEARSKLVGVQRVVAEESPLDAWVPSTETLDGTRAHEAGPSLGGAGRRLLDVGGTQHVLFAYGPAEDAPLNGGSTGLPGAAMMDLENSKSLEEYIECFDQQRGDDGEHVTNDCLMELVKHVKAVPQLLDEIREFLRPDNLDYIFNEHPRSGRPLLALVALEGSVASQQLLADILLHYDFAVPVGMRHQLSQEFYYITAAIEEVINPLPFLFDAVEESLRVHKSHDAQYHSLLLLLGSMGSSVPTGDDRQLRALRILHARFDSVMAENLAVESAFNVFINQAHEAYGSMPAQERMSWVAQANVYDPREMQEAWAHANEREQNLMGNATIEVMARLLAEAHIGKGTHNGYGIGIEYDDDIREMAAVLSLQAADLTYATQALSNLGHPDSAQRVRRLVDHRKPSLRSTGAHALRSFPGRESARVLMRRLHSADEQHPVVSSAIEAMMEWPDEHLVENEEIFDGFLQYFADRHDVDYDVCQAKCAIGCVERQRHRCESLCERRCHEPRLVERVLAHHLHTRWGVLPRHSPHRYMTPDARSDESHWRHKGAKRMVRHLLDLEGVDILGTLEEIFRYTKFQFKEGIDDSYSYFLGGKPYVYGGFGLGLTDVLELNIGLFGGLFEIRINDWARCGFDMLYDLIKYDFFSFKAAFHGGLSFSVPMGGKLVAGADKLVNNVAKQLRKGLARIDGYLAVYEDAGQDALDTSDAFLKQLSVMLTKAMKTIDVLKASREWGKTDVSRLLALIGKVLFQRDPVEQLAVYLEQFVVEGSALFLEDTSPVVAVVSLSDELDEYVDSVVELKGNMSASHHFAFSDEVSSVGARMIAASEVTSNPLNKVANAIRSFEDARVSLASTVSTYERFQHEASRFGSIVDNFEELHVVPYRARLGNFNDMWSEVQSVIDTIEASSIQGGFDLDRIKTTMLSFMSTPLPDIRSTITQSAMTAVQGMQSATLHHLQSVLEMFDAEVAATTATAALRSSVDAAGAEFTTTASQLLDSVAVLSESIDDNGLLSPADGLLNVTADAWSETSANATELNRAFAGAAVRAGSALAQASAAATTATSEELSQMGATILPSAFSALLEEVHENIGRQSADARAAVTTALASLRETVDAGEDHLLDVMHGIKVNAALSDVAETEVSLSESAILDEFVGLLHSSVPGVVDREILADLANVEVVDAFDDGVGTVGAGYTAQIVERLQALAVHTLPTEDSSTNNAAADVSAASEAAAWIVNHLRGPDAIASLSAAVDAIGFALSSEFFAGPTLLVQPKFQDAGNLLQSEPLVVGGDAGAVQLLYDVKKFEKGLQGLGDFVVGADGSGDSWLTIATDETLRAALEEALDDACSRVWLLDSDDALLDSVIIGGLRGAREVASSADIGIVCSNFRTALSASQYVGGVVAAAGDGLELPTVPAAFSQSSGTAADVSLDMQQAVTNVARDTLYPAIHGAMRSLGSSVACGFGGNRAQLSRIAQGVYDSIGYAAGRNDEPLAARAEALLVELLGATDADAGPCVPRSIALRVAVTAVGFMTEARTHSRLAELVGELESELISPSATTAIQLLFDMYRPVAYLAAFGGGFIDDHEALGATGERWSSEWLAAAVERVVGLRISNEAAFPQNWLQTSCANLKGLADTLSVRMVSAAQLFTERTAERQNTEPVHNATVEAAFRVAEIASDVRDLLPCADNSTTPLDAASFRGQNATELLENLRSQYSVLRDVWAAPDVESLVASGSPAERCYVIKVNASVVTQRCVETKVIPPVLPDDFECDSDEPSDCFETEVTCAELGAVEEVDEQVCVPYLSLEDAFSRIQQHGSYATVAQLQAAVGSLVVGVDAQAVVSDISTLHAILETAELQADLVEGLLVAKDTPKSESHRVAELIEEGMRPVVGRDVVQRSAMARRVMSRLSHAGVSQLVSTLSSTASALQAVVTDYALDDSESTGGLLPVPPSVGAAAEALRSAAEWLEFAQAGAEQVRDRDGYAALLNVLAQASAALRAVRNELDSAGSWAADERARASVALAGALVTPELTVVFADQSKLALLLNRLDALVQLYHAYIEIATADGPLSPSHSMLERRRYIDNKLYGLIVDAVLSGTPAAARLATPLRLLQVTILRVRAMRGASVSLTSSQSLDRAVRTTASFNMRSVRADLQRSASTVLTIVHTASLVDLRDKLAELMVDDSSSVVSLPAHLRNEAGTLAGLFASYALRAVTRADMAAARILSSRDGGEAEEASDALELVLSVFEMLTSLKRFARSIVLLQPGPAIVIAIAANAIESLMDRMPVDLRGSGTFELVSSQLERTVAAAELLHPIMSEIELMRQADTSLEDLLGAEEKFGAFTDGWYERAPTYQLYRFVVTLQDGRSFRAPFTAEQKEEFTAVSDGIVAIVAAREGPVTELTMSARQVATMQQLVGRAVTVCAASAQQARVTLAGNPFHEAATARWRICSPMVRLGSTVQSELSLRGVALGVEELYWSVRRVAQLDTQGTSVTAVLPDGSQLVDVTDDNITAAADFVAVLLESTAQNFQFRVAASGSLLLNPVRHTLSKVLDLLYGPELNMVPTIDRIVLQDAIEELFGALDAAPASAMRPLEFTWDSAEMRQAVASAVRVASLLEDATVVAAGSGVARSDTISALRDAASALDSLPLEEPQSHSVWNLGVRNVALVDMMLSTWETQQALVSGGDQGELVSDVNAAMQGIVELTTERFAPDEAGATVLNDIHEWASDAAADFVDMAAVLGALGVVPSRAVAVERLVRSAVEAHMSAIHLGPSLLSNLLSWLREIVAGIDAVPPHVIIHPAVKRVMSRSFEEHRIAAAAVIRELSLARATAGVAALSLYGLCGVAVGTFINSVEDNVDSDGRVTAEYVADGLSDDAADAYDAIGELVAAEVARKGCAANSVVINAANAASQRMTASVPILERASGVAPGIFDDFLALRQDVDDLAAVLAELSPLLCAGTTLLASDVYTADEWPVAYALLLRISAQRRSLGSSTRVSKLLQSPAASIDGLSTDAALDEMLNAVAGAFGLEAAVMDSALSSASAKQGIDFLASFSAAPQFSAEHGTSSHCAALSASAAMALVQLPQSVNELANLASAESNLARVDGVLVAEVGDVMSALISEGASAPRVTLGWSANLFSRVATAVANETTSPLAIVTPGLAQIFVATACSVVAQVNDLSSYGTTLDVTLAAAANASRASDGAFSAAAPAVVAGVGGGVESVTEQLSDRVAYALRVSGRQQLDDVAAAVPGALGELQSSSLLSEWCTTLDSGNGRQCAADAAAVGAARVLEYSLLELSDLLVTEELFGEAARFHGEVVLVGQMVLPQDIEKFALSLAAAAYSLELVHQSVRLGPFCDRLGRALLRVGMSPAVGAIVPSVWAARELVFRIGRLEVLEEALDSVDAVADAGVETVAPAELRDLLAELSSGLQPLLSATTAADMPSQVLQEAARAETSRLSESPDRLSFDELLLSLRHPRAIAFLTQDEVLDAIETSNAIVAGSSHATAAALASVSISRFASRLLADATAAVFRNLQEGADGVNVAAASSAFDVEHSLEFGLSATAEVSGLVDVYKLQGAAVLDVVGGAPPSLLVSLQSRFAALLDEIDLSEIAELPVVLAREVRSLQHSIAALESSTGNLSHSLATTRSALVWLGHLKRATGLSDRLGAEFGGVSDAVGVELASIMRMVSARCVAGCGFDSVLTATLVDAIALDELRTTVSSLFGGSLSEWLSGGKELLGRATDAAEATLARASSDAIFEFSPASEAGLDMLDEFLSTAMSDDAVVNAVGGVSFTLSSGFSTTASTRVVLESWLRLRSFRVSIELANLISAALELFATAASESVDVAMSTAVVNLRAYLSYAWDWCAREVVLLGIAILRGAHASSAQVQDQVDVIDELSLLDLQEFAENGEQRSVELLEAVVGALAPMSVDELAAVHIASLGPLITAFATEVANAAPAGVPQEVREAMSAAYASSTSLADSISTFSVELPPQAAEAYDGDSAVEYNEVLASLSQTRYAVTTYVLSLAMHSGTAASEAALQLLDSLSDVQEERWDRGSRQAVSVAAEVRDLMAVVTELGVLIEAGADQVLLARVASSAIEVMNNRLLEAVVKQSGDLIVRLNDFAAEMAESFPPPQETIETIEEALLVADNIDGFARQTVASGRQVVERADAAIARINEFDEEYSSWLGVSLEELRASMISVNAIFDAGGVAVSSASEYIDKGSVMKQRLNDLLGKVLATLKSKMEIVFGLADIVDDTIVTLEREVLPHLIEITNSADATAVAADALSKFVSPVIPTIVDGLQDTIDFFDGKTDDGQVVAELLEFAERGHALNTKVARTANLGSALGETSTCFSTLHTRVLGIRKLANDFREASIVVQEFLPNLLDYRRQMRNIVDGMPPADGLRTVFATARSGVSFLRVQASEFREKIVDLLQDVVERGVTKLVERAELFAQVVAGILENGVAKADELQDTLDAVFSLVDRRDVINSLVAEVVELLRPVTPAFDLTEAFVRDFIGTTTGGSALAYRQLAEGSQAVFSRANAALSFLHNIEQGIAEMVEVAAGMEPLVDMSGSQSCVDGAVCARDVLVCGLRKVVVTLSTTVNGIRDLDSFGAAVPVMVDEITSVVGDTEDIPTVFSSLDSFVAGFVSGSAFGLPEFQSPLVILERTVQLDSVVRATAAKVVEMVSEFKVLLKVSGDAACLTPLRLTLATSPFAADHGRIRYGPWGASQN